MYRTRVNHNVGQELDLGFSAYSDNALFLHDSRLYIMTLDCRSLKFSSITHHARVTQCLGSIGGHVWYLGVAKPSLVEPDQVEADKGSNAVQSHDGHFYIPPAIEDVRVFRFSGPKFVKLNMGTWHAGPLFNPQIKMDFYNLELSNTHVSVSVSIFLLPL